MPSEIRNFAEFAQKMDIGGYLLTNTQKIEIDQQGYTTMPISEDRWRMAGVSLEELRHRVDTLLTAEGPFSGREGKEDTLDGVKTLEPGARRLANLIDKGNCFRKLILMPELLAITHHALRDEFRLSSLNFREPMPGVHQRLHIDWLPRKPKDGDRQLGILAMVFLDSMDSSNGPLRLIPRTHLLTGWPDDHLDPYKPQPKEVFVSAKAGTVIIMNINLFHGGTPNLSGKRRRTLMVNYRRRDIPQLLNQRRFLSPKVMNSLSSVERYLLSVRPEDPVQEEDSVGVASAYTAKWGATGISHDENES